MTKKVPTKVTGTTVATITVVALLLEMRFELELEVLISVHAPFPSSV
jgi:hypothetical protein